jgi:hypothetical protein
MGEQTSAGMTGDAPGVVETIPTLDAILDAHSALIAGDFTPYRNHCYRIANLCVAQTKGGTEVLEKIAIAAAFHDLGIWTDNTFDYLEPSVRQVEPYLASRGLTAWTGEIDAMIRQHHKITRYRGDAGVLVEPFRRSDWIDVTRGVLLFGMQRAYLRTLYARWPDAGFHRLLVRLELRHLRAHPLNPLPVFKL